MSLQPNYHHLAISGDGSDLPSSIRYQPHEENGVAKQKRRLARLDAQRPDWIAPPANDNFGWPLAKALLAEKNHELLRYAIKYRQIESSANDQEPLLGSSPLAGIVNVEHETYVRPDGELTYGKVHRSTSVDSIAKTPARKKSVANDQTTFASQRVAGPWRGDDRLNAMIDNKEMLGRLRAALGAIVDPFEMLVLEGRTYEDAGRSMGVMPTRGAQYAARAMVHMGLLAVKRTLGVRESPSKSPYSERGISLTVRGD
jgi:hypothetical protein